MIKRLILILLLLPALAIAQPIKKQTVKVMVITDSLSINGVWMHSGNFLLNTDIGYIDSNNIWLGTNTFNAVVTKALSSTISTVTDSTINWSLSNNFYKSITGTQRFVFTGLTEGQIINVMVNNTASYTVTWVSPVGYTIKWSGGVAPVQTASKVDIYTFIIRGTDIYGLVSKNY